jgi:hypothetical protein
VTDLAVDRTGVPRNPYGVEGFARFHRNRLLLFTRDQDRVLRVTVANPGTIRRFLMPALRYVGAMGPFSWTENSFSPDAPRGPGGQTNPLRYLISTTDTLTAGNLLSNPMMRPAVPPSVAYPAPPLVLAGNVQGRPTLRQRVPSFGSRIPALNTPVAGDLEG